MIRAAQAAFLVLPEPERDAAVGAKFVDKTDTPLAVPKTYETLAHQLHAHGRTIRLGNFRYEQERRPIAAQQFAHQRTRTDPGELFVLFTRHHGDVSSGLCYAFCRRWPL